MEQRNVTKQMVENWVENGKVIQQDTNIFLYLTKNAVSHSMPINSQTLLSSFENSVTGAVKQGVKYDEIMNVGNWELIFSKPRGEGLLPVIKHTVYRS